MISKEFIREPLIIGEKYEVANTYHTDIIFESTGIQVNVGDILEYRGLTKNKKQEGFINEQSKLIIRTVGQLEFSLVII